MRALGTLTALALLGGVACSSEPEEPNPGLEFTGVYTVEAVQTLGNGKPYEGEQVSFEWQVESFCESAVSDCTAIASGTDPSPTSSLNTERLELIFHDSTWTVAGAYKSKPCTDKETREPIDERTAGITVLTLTATERADGVVQKLDGSGEVIRAGSCGASGTSAFTVTRTGDLPDDNVVPDDASPIAAIVADPPGSAFHGTYSLVFTWTDDNGQPAPPGVTPALFQTTAESLCTRTADLCMTVDTRDDQGNAHGWEYRDGKFNGWYVSPLVDCPSTPGLRTHLVVVTELTNPDGAQPAQVLRGRQTRTASGDCDSVRGFDVVATRLGD